MAEQSGQFDVKAELEGLVTKIRDALASREFAEARAVTPAQIAAEKRVTALDVKRLEAVTEELAVIVEKVASADG